MALRKDKREAILAAAIAEFRDAGFEAAKMDDIAAQAQVSKRTVYNHFPSKEALFREMSGELFERVMGATSGMVYSQKTLRIQMVELATRYVAVVSNDDFMALARVVMRERVGRPDLGHDKFERLRQGDTGLGEWMRQAQQAGAITTNDPGGDARRFSGMLAEFALWPQLFGAASSLEGEEKESAIEEAVDVFLAGRAA